MPKIEITIDQEGNMRQRFFEFTEEDPACLCAEKLNNSLKAEGFENRDYKILSRTHQHGHEHTHQHGH